MVEARYSRHIDAAKTAAPAMKVASPWRTAAMIRKGAAARAPAAPTPWLMVLAISSPRVWGLSLGNMNASCCVGARLTP
ncbi:hypothetical protein G6F68_019348 [Rhizopus microsporus]|nr:hypothetical protein G6F68_019348 [Rhizopus microsporus]